MCELYKSVRYSNKVHSFTRVLKITYLAQRSRASDKLSVNSSALCTKDAVISSNMAFFSWMSWVVAEVRFTGQLVKHKGAMKRNIIVISSCTEQRGLYMGSKRMIDVQWCIREQDNMRIEQ